MDSPNISQIDFDDSYIRKDNFDMDFVCSTVNYITPMFYGSCWFKMTMLQNTFTDDLDTTVQTINSMPYYIKEYKIR